MKADDLGKKFSWPSSMQVSWYGRASGDSTTYGQRIYVPTPFGVTPKSASIASMRAIGHESYTGNIIERNSNFIAIQTSGTNPNYFIAVVLNLAY